MSANDELQAHTCEKILQEYGDVANNVAQANSQDLTEQWKKGELEAGWYYVKNEFGNIFISEYSEDYDYIGDKVVKDFFTEVSEITEVIAPVPSYDHFVELTEKVKENQQLKGLLKECKPYIGYSINKKEYLEWTPPDSNILTVIDNAIGEKK